MNFRHLMILAAFVLLISPTPVVAASYYETPEPSPVIMHLAGTLTIGGADAAAGDEICVLDGNGKVVGHFIVERPGIFGDLAVSGDSDLTAEDEGVLPGEALEVRVWQASSGTEYYGGSVVFYKPSGAEAIYFPYPDPQLRFEGNSFYLIDIAAGE